MSLVCVLTRKKAGLVESEPTQKMLEDEDLETGSTLQKEEYNVILSGGKSYGILRTIIFLTPL